MRFPLVAVSLMAVLLTGCGGDDAASSPKPSTSSSASSSATEDASPTPTPAAGPLLDGEVSTVNAPQGWALDDYALPWSKNASDHKMPGQQSMLLLEAPWPGTADPLDEMAQTATTKAFRGKARRQPDVTLDGEPAYHVSGTALGAPADEFGLITREHWVRLTIRSAGYTAAQRQALLDSVLASFRWKD